MRRLILMRHAKSSWDSAGLADHARPLNPRGVASAAAMGDWLRQNGYVPDQVICSSARRTQETLEGLGLDDAAPQITDALYHAGPADILAALRSAEGRCVLILGHNPGMADFAVRILSDAPDHARFDDFPTCATLVADFDVKEWSEVAWGQGHATDFAIPREVLGKVR
ncbi:histidine phosphatase family protein [Aliishimia ponticola]|uniref:Histidine phosphatase family protein n=1 Tax=Aliishimia ponticola TaxID=2499833 RepID=A0A4S4N5T3_9RHOB|nr:histidine phosphatase family protein [Aliishimia ponticola]THH34462.1 histidine phosphatase family protein [Aliishimia ponticola]